ncbi:MAG: tRNA lysidine(34) synthetase TilS [Aggregatilineales bacterium]
MLTESLILHVRKFFEQQESIVPINPLIVAVSGGIDSLALMHILSQISKSMPLNLYVATLDHGLRGDAGQADREVVEALADRWGIVCIGGSADVVALAQAWQTSIENAARRARYTFLAEVARQTGAKTIVTAHHAGDQAETVLMRLLRGAGTAGLGGMKAIAPLPYQPELSLLRPLLAITKADLAAYCAENDLIPRHDATNDDDKPLRNFVRLRVLPKLREHNPNIETTLGRIAQTAQLDESFIESQYVQIVVPHLTNQDGAVLIDRTQFMRWHPALQRRCVARNVSKLLSDLADDSAHPQFEHIIHAVDVGMTGQVGTQAQFSGGIHLRVDYEYLVIEAINSPYSASIYPQLPEKLEILLEIEKNLTMQGAGWELYLSATPIEDANAMLFVPDGAQILLRTRREGDRFAPIGMKGHSRRLKSWLIDQKIPRQYRDLLPLLTINGEIAAILTYKRWFLSENFRYPTSDSTKIYFFVNSL